MERKVTITNGRVFEWMACYPTCQGPCGDTFVFPMSYSSVLPWVKKLRALLAGEQMQLTTHSFRRSGASELSRRNVALLIFAFLIVGCQIAVRGNTFGRLKSQIIDLVLVWHSVAAGFRENWSRWASLISHVWMLQKQLQQSHFRVHEASFRKLEMLVFPIYDV